MDPTHPIPDTRSPTVPRSFCLRRFICRSPPPILYSSFSSSVLHILIHGTDFNLARFPPQPTSQTSASANCPSKCSSQGGYATFIIPYTTAYQLNKLVHMPTTPAPEYRIHLHLNVRRVKLLIPTNTASQ